MYQNCKSERNKTDIKVKIRVYKDTVKISFREHQKASPKKSKTCPVNLDDMTEFLKMLNTTDENEKEEVIPYLENVEIILNFEITIDELKKAAQ